MRFGISTLFALTALTASTATAFAQDAPAPAAPAPTESLDTAAQDSNVSTIHGQLVPVGDKNQYTYDFKRFNVSTNPLGLMYGSYGLSMSYGVTQNIALRADLNYRDTVGDDEGDLHQEGFELGVSAPIYLRRTYQGAFVEPGVVFSKMETSIVGEDALKVSVTELGPQVLLGWHWSWDSGLNIALAAGVGRNFSSDEAADGEVHQDVFVNGYLRVGYAF